MAVTSPYDGVTPERIKEEMLADLKVKGANIDTREGSYANILVSVAAYQMFKLYQQFPGLLSMAFPDENAGEYIDRHAAQIGMVRTPGQKATVPIVFTGVDGTYIPAGTVLYAPEIGLRYATVEDVSISGGTTRVRAAAAEIGADYNLPAGYITAMYVNIAGVAGVTNPEAATGGVDVESDADFSARYHDRRTLPITSGNKNHYITWATEVTGVAYASCIPLWNGNGTVKVVIGGPNRGAVDEVIRAACAAHIEAERPIGEREIPLTASVTLVEGFTAGQVEDQLEVAVNELLTGQEFGEEVSIPFSRFLACLLRCPGVADYSVFTVDDGTAAVTLQPEDAAVVGSVSIVRTGGGA